MITRPALLRSAAVVALASALPVRARAANQTLNVGQIGNNSIAFFPIFVASERGFFRAAGLDVAVTDLQTGALVGAALTSGGIDIGCGVMTDVFALLKASRPVKVVGSLVDGYYVDVVAANGFLHDAKLDRSQPVRAKMTALRGKKVGITGPGSGTEALMNYLCKGAGLDPTRDLELVNVGTDQGSILTQMRTGRLDAVSFAWPLSMVAETQNIGRAYISPAAGDVAAMRGELHGAMYARPDVIEKRGDAVAAFVKAVGRAQALIRTDPRTAHALLTKYDAQLDGAVIARLNAAYLPVLPRSPRVSEAAFAKAVAFHTVTGFATGAERYRDVVATDLIAKAL